VSSPATHRNDNSDQKTHGWEDRIRFAIDLGLAITGLVLLWPMILCLGLAVTIDSGGPVFYLQERLGYGGKPFKLIKFRTMRVRAEVQLSQLLDGDPGLLRSWSAYQKLPDDPRLTRAGRFLRRFSLDELPQLINVIRGEMSLVGPRPILPNQRMEYGPNFERYIQVKPGMTGLWQVSGRNQTTFSKRIELDQRYLVQRSIGLDLYIIFRTIWVVVSGVGAY
jgi:lipopolysaccharide/colanic/teichoic acid biosynthesis glycosyltransferase